MEPELDRDTLGGLREQMGEEYPDLLRIFSEESQRHLDALEAGIEAGAWKDARRAAHSLKSSAALFGLLRLAAVMRSLEEGPETMTPQEWRVALGEARKLRESGLRLLTL